jgi:hypothetical protein
MFCLNLNFQPPQGLEPLIFQHLNAMFYFHSNKIRWLLNYQVKKWSIVYMLGHAFF